MRSAQTAYGVPPSRVALSFSLSLSLSFLLGAGVKTHTVVSQALEALTHLDHRGAAAADPLRCAALLARRVDFEWGRLRDALPLMLMARWL
jgi:hypothetical protein